LRLLKAFTGYIRVGLPAEGLLYYKEVIILWR